MELDVPRGQKNPLRTGKCSVPNLTTCLLCENDHVNWADTNQMGDENNSTLQGVETQMARLSLQEVTNHQSVIPPPDRAASSAATTATSRDPSI